MVRSVVRFTALFVFSFVFLFSTVDGSGADPTPSDASPPYPLNHTFDADPAILETHPENYDFETAEYSPGAPANSDLEEPEEDVGTPPANHDFETADFTGWTTSGTTSIQSNGTEGYYAQLASGGTLISSAFTVDSGAQSFGIRVGLLNTSTDNRVRIYVLHGTDYATQTEIGYQTCNQCSVWRNVRLNAGAYLGESVKLKFVRESYGTIGINNVRNQINFPEYTTSSSGGFNNYADSGDNYARLDGDAYVTTSAFFVEEAADHITLNIKGINGSGLSKYSVYVLSGVDYATSTTIWNSVYAPSGWNNKAFNVYAWKGQWIKIRVQEIDKGIGVDDIQLYDEVPDWDVTGSAWTTGSGDRYLGFSSGYVTSQPVTLPDDADQLSLEWDPNNFASYYVYVLSGEDFSTATQLDYVYGNHGWVTYKVGIATYAGQTVKIQFRNASGMLYLDNIQFESAVPGWTITSGGASMGSDSYGAYVTPAESGGSVWLRSSQIDTGLIDPGAGGRRYFSITYEIGFSTGNTLFVRWYDSSGSVQVLLDTADSPAGVKTNYFFIHSSWGQIGKIEVRLAGGGKIYSVADNVARQHLREPFSNDVGTGIDTTTGGFHYQDRDLVVSGRVPLAFNRYYNAQSGAAGTLGHRWTHSFDTHLVFNDDDVGVVFGSGSEEFFRWDSTPGEFYPVDKRIKDELIKNVDNSYTLETKQNLTFDFTSGGRLESITDLNDNQVSFTYDVNGRLETVADPDGREIDFTYDTNGRISTVTGPDSAVFEYTYNANGDLISVKDPEQGIREYDYDKHLLTEARDQEDNVLITNSYDDVNRVTTQTDADSNTITLDYATPAKGVTTVTDPLTNQAKYYFDGFGRTTAKVDQAGNTVTYIYDGDGNLEKIVDPNLDEWLFDYDSSADLIETEDPLGNPISIAYNAQHLPTTVTDARGYTTYMTYDGSGNVLTVTDPTREVVGVSEEAVGGCGIAGTGDGDDDDSDTVIDDGCPSTIYMYDGEGKMTSKTDAIGRAETYGYTNGNRTSMVDGNNKTWAWTYDAAGRVTSETNPEAETTDYVYDLFGRPILERNNLDEETTYLYDLAGHLLMVEDELGNQTFWDYDERGLVERKIDAVDNEWHYSYDANRNMTSVTEPTRLPVSTAESGADCGTAGTGDGEDDDSDDVVDDGCPSTLYTYDENNRLETVTDGTGGVTTYTYDDAGQLLLEEDPLGRTTSYAYDDAGRLVQMTLPNDGVWSYVYDENGNLETETDPLLNVTSYTYDPLNRRVAVTDPLLNVTEYTYDPAGQLIEVLDAELNTTSYEYDDAGRMISITDPMMNVRTFGYDDAGRRITVIDGLDRETAYTYDGAGRLGSVIAPGNFTTEYDYDGAGRMISVTQPNGGITTYTYDPRGLMNALTDPLRQPDGTPESGADCGTDGTGNGVDDDSDTVIDDGCPSTIYGYDDAGRRTSMTDALGRGTTYEFDGAGRMITMTDALDGAVSFGYDAAGQQTSVTNARGKTTSYTLDDLGNIATKTDPLSRVHEWVYDAAGRLVETTDARDVTVSYGYDDNGNLTSVTYPGGSVSYEYDDIGRRTEMTDATGTTIWNYDASSRVTSVVSPNGTVSYTYDDADARETMTLPGSRTFAYDYDATTGRLDSIEDWEARVISFAYDDNGNRTGIERPNSIDSTYAYDLAGRLTSIVHADGLGPVQSFAYTLDAAGNRTGVTHGGGTESYTLDDLNRITAVDYPTGDDVEYEYDAGGNITEMTVGQTTTTFTHDDADQLTSDGTDSYYYDDNGNLTDAGDDEFEWDYRNMMTSATIDSTTTDYAYDGDGVRVAKETTDYLYDRVSGLPMLVDDETNAYLHEGGVLASIDGSDDALYLLGDALGSVRGVTDEAGDLDGTADYAVFGEVRASTGVSTLFRFTGEQHDLETGFTYLRARYANPALGRFVSADSVQPNAPGTQGYNLYAYAGNNPTTWVDPSGHVVGPSFAAITAIVLANPELIPTLLVACAAPLMLDAGVAALNGGQTLSKGLGVNAGVVTSVCIKGVVGIFAIPTLICAMSSECFGQAREWADQMERGTWSPDGVFDGTWEDLQNMVDRFPEIPGITNLFSDSEDLVVSPERAEHILHGDEFGGGHLYGAGGKGVTEFPEDWTEDEILGAIEAIANDEGIPLQPQAHGTSIKVGVIDGLEIEVIIHPTEGILTGYPAPY